MKDRKSRNNNIITVQKQIAVESNSGTFQERSQKDYTKREKGTTTKKSKLLQKKDDTDTFEDEEHFPESLYTKSVALVLLEKIHTTNYIAYTKCAVYCNYRCLLYCHTTTILSITSRSEFNSITSHTKL